MLQIKKEAAVDTPLCVFSHDLLTFRASVYCHRFLLSIASFGRKGLWIVSFRHLFYVGLYRLKVWDVTEAGKSLVLQES